MLVWLDIYMFKRNVCLFASLYAYVSIPSSVCAVFLETFSNGAHDVI